MNSFPSQGDMPERDTSSSSRVHLIEYILACAVVCLITGTAMHAVAAQIADTFVALSDSLSRLI